MQLPKGRQRELPRMHVGDEGGPSGGCSGQILSSPSVNEPVIACKRKTLATVGPHGAESLFSLQTSFGFLSAWFWSGSGRGRFSTVFPPAVIMQFHLPRRPDGNRRIQAHVSLEQPCFLCPPPQIYLRFLDYQMEHSNECKRNFVAVYDGSSSIENLKAKFCSTVANDVTLKTGVGVIRMWADEGSRLSRFRMLFTSFVERKYRQTPPPLPR